MLISRNAWNVVFFMCPSLILSSVHSFSYNLISRSFISASPTQPWLFLLWTEPDLPSGAPGELPVAWRADWPGASGWMKWVNQRENSYSNPDLRAASVSPPAFNLMVRSHGCTHIRINTTFSQSMERLRFPSWFYLLKKKKGDDAWK